jgi:chromosomal replication initiation ATPase DnaA
MRCARTAGAACWRPRPDRSAWAPCCRTCARARGLELPADAARYLLSRLPRDAGSLVEALDRLDRALLSAQRRLTVAFLQQWLKEPPPPSPQA